MIYLYDSHKITQVLSYTIHPIKQASHHISHVFYNITKNE
jgi:hypothetical protein